MLATPTITATFNGQPMNVLDRMVNARMVGLRQGADKAVRGTAIQVLQSLRAQTGKAKKRSPHVIDDRWRVEISRVGGSVGWRTKKGGKRSQARRVVRGLGETFDCGPKHGLINIAGNYAMGPLPELFDLKIYSLPTPSKPFYSVKVIANCEFDVRKFAAIRIQRRIGQYAGVSKRVLGLLMHCASRNGGTVAAGDGIYGAAADTFVKYSGNVENSGRTCAVSDALPYAMRALANGARSLNTAIANAAKRIRKVIEKRGYEQLAKTINFDDLERAQP